MDGFGFWGFFANPFSFSALQQLGADPQHWTEVYAILKGTSLSCYHRQQDVEASVQPAFTIAINKVGTSRIIGGLKAPDLRGWACLSVHALARCYLRCRRHWESRMGRLPIAATVNFTQSVALRQKQAYAPIVSAFTIEVKSRMFCFQNVGVDEGT